MQSMCAPACGTDLNEVCGLCLFSAGYVCKVSVQAMCAPACGTEKFDVDVYLCI